MGGHTYRWSVLYALTRTLASLLGWTLIVGLPGLLVWMMSLGTPGRELLVVLGIAGVILGCSLIHSRRYWRRFFDRSPQLEFDREYVRAPQLDGERIPWNDIVKISGQERNYQDFACLVLHTAHDEIELDIAGLDASMRSIFQAAEAMWRQCRRENGHH